MKIAPSTTIARNILLTLLVFVTSNVSRAQDCSILNEFTQFRGFRFGATFPDSLKAYTIHLDNKKFKSSYIFAERFKTNPPDFLSKLHNWLFLNGQFDELTIYCSEKDIIYKIVLMKSFEYQDSVELSNKQYPKFYENVSLELATMFGKASSEGLQTLKDIGSFMTKQWSCDRMSIDFSFYPTGDYRFYSLTFTDNYLEKKIKIDEYKQP